MNLSTVKKFSQKHPSFPEGGLRFMIFNASRNGLAPAIKRVGRKVLIDETAFFAWVEDQQRTPKAVR